jgi:hypothetical protein
VDALTRVEAAEGHLELVSDRHRARLDVGELAGKAPAALESTTAATVGGWSV